MLWESEILYKEGQVNVCFTSRFVYHTWIPFHYFWRDVTFCKQIAWEVSALFCWCECLLMVDARLGIRALEPDLVWFHQSTMFWFGWWSLMNSCHCCIKRSWLIIFLFLVGKLHMITVILYTIYWCPFGNWWNFLSFYKSTDALSWHLTILKIIRWMSAWVGPGWVRPCAWGCPAGVLATWPWCHFLKVEKMSFTRNSKTFYYWIEVLFRYHPDIIIYYGWILVLQQKYIYYQLMYNLYFIL